MNIREFVLININDGNLITCLFCKNKIEYSQGCISCNISYYLDSIGLFYESINLQIFNENFKLKIYSWKDKHYIRFYEINGNNGLYTLNLDLSFQADDLFKNSFNKSKIINKLKLYSNFS